MERERESETGGREEEVVSEERRVEVGYSWEDAARSGSVLWTRGKKRAKKRAKKGSR